MTAWMRIWAEPTLSAANDDYQWMTFERERMWWSGVKEDPSRTGRDATVTRSDIGVASGDKWDGVAQYIAERSVVNGGNFVTNFNTGHGLSYYLDGQVSNAKEWSNINLQDILPTWQWWMESTSASKLKADFDYGPGYTKSTGQSYEQLGAYKGGSSLVVSGNLDADNFLHLYKTDLQVKASSKLSVTFNKPKDSVGAKMKVGVVLKSDPSNTVYFDVPDSDTLTNGWATKEISLADLDGQSIAAVGLSFAKGADNVADYQINVGEIKLTDGSAAKPAQPTDFKVDKAMADTGELYVSWDMNSDYSKVKEYHLYANDKFVGGIYDSVYYLKSLKELGDQVNLKLTAVGADGTESDPAALSFDFGDKVKNVAVTESEGSVTATWTNPSGATGPIELKLSLPYNSQSAGYTKTAAAGAESAAINVAEHDGERYELAISVGGAAPVIYTGQLHDNVSKAYDGTITYVNKQIKLDAPTSKDWWHMYIRQNGVLQTFTVNGTSYDYVIRGKVNFPDITATGKGTIEIVLEDYAGNMSEPIAYQYDEPFTSTDFPDPLLFNAVQEQIGTTKSQLAAFNGTLNLSGLAIANYKGMELLTSLKSVDLSHSKLTGLYKNIFSPAIEKIDLSHSEALTFIDAKAFAGLANLKEIDVTGDANLQAINISNTTVERLIYGDKLGFGQLKSLDLRGSQLDLSEETSERAFVDQIKTQVAEGDVVKVDGDYGDLAPEYATVVAEKTNIPSPRSITDGTNRPSYSLITTLPATAVLDLGWAQKITGFNFDFHRGMRLPLSTFLIPMTEKTSCRLVMK
ncbi:endo-beta-N-acetylglucosaminidase [Cohnella faecalis]|uniref:endo-beta-N-acetylglucosaminidase n=1 Tax=Cohnella faecalis TaxID=2315694 RepID=UPI002278AF68|nr:hypothetical protein [Cohnella faecalis]